MDPALAQALADTGLALLIALALGPVAGLGICAAEMAQRRRNRGMRGRRRRR